MGNLRIFSLGHVGGWMSFTKLGDSGMSLVRKRWYVFVQL